MIMAQTFKVDLTLLKKLIGELEMSLAAAEVLKSSSDKIDVNDYVVEMSKAIGLASGVSGEAALLVADIGAVARAGLSPKSPTKDSVFDTLDKILGGKGGGNTN